MVSGGQGTRSTGILWHQSGSGSTGACLGSGTNNWISPYLANSEGTPADIWFGVLMNLLSVVCAVAMCFLIREGDRQLADVCSISNGLD